MAEEKYDGGTLKGRKNTLQRSAGLVPSETRADAPLSQNGGLTKREQLLGEDYRLKRMEQEGHHRLSDSAKSHIVDMAQHTASEVQGLRTDISAILNRPMSPSERADVRQDAAEIYDIATGAMKDGLRQSTEQINKTTNQGLTPPYIAETTYQERTLTTGERLRGRIVEKK